MSPHPLAGRPVPDTARIDVAALLGAYEDKEPDPGNPAQRVSFGTSGHRGTAGNGSFNRAHIGAISKAIAEHRRAEGHRGPLFIARDTHALSTPALQTALEVLGAHGVPVVVQAGDGVAPTPVVSHAILCWNRAHPDAQADGIVVTPSHNPPEDGGFKYNPPHGGPADTSVTTWIQDRANAILAAQEPILAGKPGAEARDLIAAYVADLHSVVNLDLIRASGLRIAADPMGGSALPCLDPIREAYGLDLAVVNRAVDPTFAFMTLDHDGKVRMDCSSPYAMTGLMARLGDRRVAWANDPDADRHGIVTASGLMNPNHYLAVAIDYLLRHRPAWRSSARVGKTLVSSSLIDRVVAGLGRELLEVPVGFKWFAPGLADGSCCFGGEESAGASFLRRDGGVWTTDKDGILLGLLAAEMTAETGRDPGELYRELTAVHGAPLYTRVDAPATTEVKRALAALDPSALRTRELAGEPILATLTRAPGNGAPIGGLKVVAANGWFAARPSGTEQVYKIYAESFKDGDHLEAVLREAQLMVDAAVSAR